MIAPGLLIAGIAGLALVVVALVVSTIRRDFR